MKVTGETFYFNKKRKGAEEARYQKYPNFQAKGPLPDRTLESFIPKSTEEAIPNIKGNLYRVTKNNYFLISLEESFR